jgi:hypothetical protein
MHGETPHAKRSMRALTSLCGPASRPLLEAAGTRTRKTTIGVRIRTLLAIA